jgi:glycosyltransferase involved in cell wall biosynthesis
MTPHVTCLCITRGRPKFLQHAIACFNALEYQNAELLIVMDCDDTNNVIMEGPRIRPVVIDRPATIGAKRNIGCDLAVGKVIAIWDDDDYSAPERLHDQLNRLSRYSKDVTAYHTMKFTDGKQWWEYQGIKSVGVGTSLCFKKEYWKTSQFPEKNLAEDNDFILESVRARKYIAEATHDMMFAAMHPGGTSPHDLTPGRGFVTVDYTPPASAKAWMEIICQ